MKFDRPLYELFQNAARRFPERTAVEEPGAGAVTYRELERLSDRVRDRLAAWGVERGDRVGVYLRKSIDAVASIIGILKAGAAYVPVDPSAPAERNAFILRDCAVRAVIVEERFHGGLDAEWGSGDPKPRCLIVDGTGGGAPLTRALDREDGKDPAAGASSAPTGGTDLAYVLYTSGSTGKPKGVMLSNENAVSFIDWCSTEFQPGEHDRFSSHAPFHFDLSVLDLYLPLKHGAALVLVSDEIGKEPQRLAAMIAEQRLTVWYSAPSILSLLAQYGRLEGHDFSALRLVLFAGEVFPVKHLRALQQALPPTRYYNLYGPTETNVCTYFEVPRQIPADRSAPYPIGRCCAHLTTRVVDPRGDDVAAGQEGELCVSGPGVMRGYWGLAEQTARAFLTDGAGRHWYKTGDVVLESPAGCYTYLGRRDRMVKRRGYRVELGEIEAGLYRHPVVKEAAVVALPDTESGIKIKAFLSSHGVEHPSLIALKSFCAEVLPLYMIPDLFSWEAQLPKTSTDKIDYQRLREIG